MRSPWLVRPLALGNGVVFVLLASVAQAQVAVTAIDKKVALVNGVVQVVRNPAPDTLAIIDLSTFPPRLLSEIEVPASVIGPPTSVAVTPDERLALVTAAMKLDPHDPTKQVEDNKLSVIDLEASPPLVIATLETGKQPSGLSVNRQGTLALVANRAEGSVSIFGISGKTVRGLGTLVVAEPSSGVSHVVFTPDGKRALVTRDNDHTLTLLAIDGAKVVLAGRDMRSGLRPYGADISSDGGIGVVANVGASGGDSDTISVVDMRAQPPRVVDTFSVGQTPEGIKLSPDGKLCGVVVVGGSNKPKESPFFAERGKLVLFRVEGARLTRVADAPIGRWSQGLAFSPDGKTLLVGNMVEKELQVFQWDGTALRDTGHRVPLSGGSAAIRTAEK